MMQHKSGMGVWQVASIGPLFTSRPDISKRQGRAAKKKAALYGKKHVSRETMGLFIAPQPVDDDCDFWAIYKPRLVKGGEYRTSGLWFCAFQQSGLIKYARRNSQINEKLKQV